MSLFSSFPQCIVVVCLLSTNSSFFTYLLFAHTFCALIRSHSLSFEMWIIRKVDTWQKQTHKVRPSGKFNASIFMCTLRDGVRWKSILHGYYVIRDKRLYIYFVYAFLSLHLRKWIVCSIIFFLRSFHPFHLLSILLSDTQSLQRNHTTKALIVLKKLFIHVFD